MLGAAVCFLKQSAWVGYLHPVTFMDIPDTAEVSGDKTLHIFLTRAHQVAVSILSETYIHHTQAYILTV